MVARIVGNAMSDGSNAAERLDINMQQVSGTIGSSAANFDKPAHATVRDGHRDVQRLRLRGLCHPLATQLDRASARLGEMASGAVQQSGFALFQVPADPFAHGWLTHAVALRRAAQVPFLWSMISLTISILRFNAAWHSYECSFG